MSTPPPPEQAIDLVLVWHFHQPDYRDRTTGEFRLPWTYLHAIKDYSDMAWHLEQHRDVRAVVNFVPVLLDQLEDYADQFAGGSLRDPLLRLLARADDELLGETERNVILERCFHANHRHMVEPFPAYRRLRDLFEAASGPDGETFRYLSDRYFLDVLTWYHLVWTGETVRRESALARRLMSQGQGFGHADRAALLALIGAIVRDIVPRYRRLAERGQIELSTTPHHHPLAPLLIDFASARESEPQAVLPEAPVYPGGEARVDGHVDSALETHARRFGARPHGIWPAEGAVSERLLRLLAARGIEWAASGERVLANSLARGDKASSSRKESLYRAWRLPSPAGGIACFFRDDRLSDLIGFEYKSWKGPDAAANFIGELTAIAAEVEPDARPVVSVILDGENAWEWYPYNGFYFLDALYTGLAKSSQIRTTTFHDWLAAERASSATRIGELGSLTAGSWVYGTFSTWIGSPEKNRAWDLLANAKRSFDAVMASGRLDEARKSRAFAQLAICEASDWFWWLGDYNPAESVASFDRLFRENLGRLYASLELPEPSELSVPISLGGGRPEAGGAMRRAS